MLSRVLISRNFIKNLQIAFDMSWIYFSKKIYVWFWSFFKFKLKVTKSKIQFNLIIFLFIFSIDLQSLENEFKKGPAGGIKKDFTDGKSKEKPKKIEKDTLLEHTRLKNIAICKRKLPLQDHVQELVRAINALDVKTLNIDAIELLQRMIPDDTEIKAYRDYTTAGKDVTKLTDEDQLMRQFSAIQRFGTKLQIMSFMSSFDETLKMVKPQVDTVSVASKSLKNSKKLKEILEMILAVGNYMNSSKKGHCYGFKLQSLDSLTITKSSDKKTDLVHYLAELVHTKFPELKDFSAELKHLEKAAQFSIENILTGKIIHRLSFSVVLR